MAFTALGLALCAVGLTVMTIGAWTVLTARRPTWLKVRTIPIGRERGWGSASLITGLGSVLLGAADILGMAAFSGLKLLGIVLLLAGVLLLVVVVRPRPSR